MNIKKYFTRYNVNGTVNFTNALSKIDGPRDLCGLIMRPLGATFYEYFLPIRFHIYFHTEFHLYATLNQNKIIYTYFN